MDALTYLIPAMNLEALKVVFANLRKKAARLAKKIGDDFVAPNFEVVGDKVVKGVLHHEVAVTGSTITVAGWAFVAAVDHREGLIKAYDTTADLTPYRSLEPTCEHCNTNRARKTSYILKSAEGQLIQVGSSCLKDFTGHHNPEAVAAAQELIKEAATAADECCGFGAGPVWFKLVEFLAVAWMNVSERGYKGASYENCTADVAWEGLNPPKGGVRVQASEEALKKAEEILAWLGNALAGDVSDYEFNLKSILDNGFVTRKSCRLAASMIVYYDRNNIKTGDDGATSEYFGTIKKREVFTLTVTAHRIIDGEFGTTHMYTFKDSNDNIAVWFSSKNAELEVDSTYTLKATVKDHKDYKGVKQTLINRCKVVR